MSSGDQFSVFSDQQKLETVTHKPFVVADGSLLITDLWMVSFGLTHHPSLITHHFMKVTGLSHG